MTNFDFMRPRLRPPLSYLVLVQPMLVAVDIGMAIEDFVPRANVIIAPDAAAAGQALQALDSLHVAFIGLAPASDNGLRLADAVRMRGGRMVFIGDEAEKLGPGPDWTVLVRPFSTDCVFQALKGLPKSRSGPPARQVDIRYPSAGLPRAPVAALPDIRAPSGQTLASDRFARLLRT